MRLWPRRSPVPAARANPTRTALLEHALNGTEPAPGTWAATVVAMKRAGACVQHRPIISSHLGDEPRTRGACEGCWRYMVLNDAGDWVIAPNP